LVTVLHLADAEVRTCFVCALIVFFCAFMLIFGR